MEEQFVTFPIAEKLKELGFDEPCLGVFGLYSKELLISEASKGLCNADHELILAPLWQQAIDWFREKGIRIYECYPFDTWSVSEKIKEHEYCHEGWKFTREQAVLKALKLIKTNDNEIN